ncbi:MAG: circularly permuted type 2 ATP-grasp protein, partial [Ilumatobacteraceae bacterium]
MPAATLPALAYGAEPGRFDEALDGDGGLRPMWSRLVASLGQVTPAIFAERQRQADRLLDAEGAGHLVHEISLHRGATPEHGGSSFRLDPLPFPISHDEFTVLAAAATQRMRVLEAVLGDIYGERRLVRERALPAQTLYSLPSFKPGGVTRGRRLVTYALDVARGADGRWGVVRDITDSAGGLGVSLLLRSVIARLLPDAMRLAGVAPINDHYVALRRALLACAPSDRRSPRCVLLTPGPAYRSYVEHSYLATQLGYHLVGGADLVMREGRLWLRALDGLEPVDVLFRRVRDDDLDPLEARTAAGVGVPGVVWGFGRGGIGVANAPGTAVAQEAAVAGLLGHLAQKLLGETLQLQPLEGPGLASTPVVGSSSNAFASGQVVVRLHAVAGPDGITVMPGATARIVQPAGAAVTAVTTLKDVWVIGGPPASRRATVRTTSAPQVDLFTSLPKRAADSLFWLGRSAERAEVAARTAREVRGQLDRDPGLGVDASGWAAGALALTRAAQATSPTAALVGVPSMDRLAAEVELTCAVVAAQL